MGVADGVRSRNLFGRSHKSNRYSGGDKPTAPLQLTPSNSQGPRPGRYSGTHRPEKRLCQPYSLQTIPLHRVGALLQKSDCFKLLEADYFSAEQSWGQGTALPKQSMPQAPHTPNFWGRKWPGLESAGGRREGRRRGRAPLSSPTLTFRGQGSRLGPRPGQWR